MVVMLVVLRATVARDKPATVFVHREPVAIGLVAADVMG